MYGASGMTQKTDDLTDIFLDVADGETLTERQQEGPSRDPIEESDAELEASVVRSTREDGLDDAVDGDLGGSGAATT